jgi:hypothetical protein
MDRVILPEAPTSARPAEVQTRTLRQRSPVSDQMEKQAAMTSRWLLSASSPIPRPTRMPRLHRRELTRQRYCSSCPKLFRAGGTPHRGC